MPDVILGSSYTPQFRILETDGSPNTSGVTGTLSLYYANGTSSAAVTSGSLAHQGDGWWGYPLAASFLASAGLYYATTGSISGTATLGPLGQAFTTGEYDPSEMTLRDLLVHLLTANGDGYESTTTSAGSTSTLVDARWVDSGMVSNELVGSEVLFLEPGGVSDANPVRVTASNHSTGTLTFTPTVTSVGDGTDYILIHRRGTGHGYRRYLRAIQAAARRYRPMQWVTDETSLSTVSGEYELAAPRGWLRVDRVWHDPARLATGQRDWREIAPAYWRWNGDIRAVRLDRDHGGGVPVRIAGWLERLEPAGLTSVVPGPWTQLADEVAGELGLGQRDRSSMRIQRGRSQRARR